MKRKIIITGDGSKTILIEDWQEQYHSKHGAINEARHVFIKNGLEHYIAKTKKNNISILEIGFGTGLNAFLSAIEAEKIHCKINYTGVEAYPVKKEEIQQLNYVDQIDATASNLYAKLHDCEWETTCEISPNFKLIKRQQFFSDINDKDCFDLIYFDAFGARVQPELWTKEIFKKMYEALKVGGVLVTYAAIGKVKRDMLELGFAVERLPGPPGKRHMLRATQ